MAVAAKTKTNAKQRLAEILKRRPLPKTKRPNWFQRLDEQRQADINGVLKLWATGDPQVCLRTLSDIAACIRETYQLSTAVSTIRETLGKKVREYG
jgi:hypothetical protein